MPKVTQEHMDSRRRQILAAASRCFARVGFHAATMQDVITESRLSAGAIYNYFSSKEDIIIAIADERHERETLLCRAAEKELDPHAAVKHLAQVFFRQLTDVAQDRERRVGVQLWAEALNNKKLLRVTQEGTLEPKRVLRKLVDALKASGELPSDVDSEALARVMIALFEGFVLQKCREKNLDIGPYVKAVLFIWDRMRMRTEDSQHKQSPSSKKARSRNCANSAPTGAGSANSD
jgi:AcrR family transcriptional regulator